MPSPESLLILGTGAMACLFAARVASTGVAVTLLGTWAEALQALQEYGVRLLETDGSLHAYPVRATNRTADCRGARYALVLVKSWQSPRAARQLSDCLDPDGLALTLQNGLGNQELLIQELGSQRVSVGVTTTGATLLEPGLVRPVGNHAVSLGVHSRLGPLAERLQRAGFSVQIVAETSGLQWGKLVINAAINPLTALLKIPNGELLNRPSARRLSGLVAIEAASVASASGVNLPYPDPVLATENVARRTAVNLSSMLRDVQRGAPTEIDAINGAIVLAGESAGVATPLNATLWHLVKALMADQPGISSFDPGGSSTNGDSDNTF